MWTQPARYRSSSYERADGQRQSRLPGAGRNCAACLTAAAALLAIAAGCGRIELPV